MSQLVDDYSYFPSGFESVININLATIACPMMRACECFVAERDTTFFDNFLQNRKKPPSPQFAVIGASW